MERGDVVLFSVRGEKGYRLGRVKAVHSGYVTVAVLPDAELVGGRYESVVYRENCVVVSGSRQGSSQEDKEHARDI